MANDTFGDSMHSTRSSARGDTDLPEVLGKPIDGLRLCYVSCINGANGFVGAVLLTDFQTRPVEFSFVSPIRPSPMQKILFGKTLDEYVSVDVIAKKLLDGLSEVPDIVFVDSKLLLNLKRITKLPVVMLGRVPESDPSIKLSALTYEFPGGTNYSAEIGAAIHSLEPHGNLLDAFDRMNEALKEAIKTAKA